MLAQINGDSDLTNNKNLLEVVNTVAAPTRTGPMRRRLLEQLQKRSPEIQACFQSDIEQKRAEWTTYNNLKTWFEIWRSNLEELGFGFTTASSSSSSSSSSTQAVLLVH